MNIEQVINQALAKTKEHKLRWQSTAEPYEVVAILGRDYVLRLCWDTDPDYPDPDDRTPRLSLETLSGQIIFLLDPDETERAYNAKEISRLWEMVRFGGKSREEATDEALERLMDL